MHTSVLFLIGLLFVICNLEYSDSFAESPSFKCNENIDRNSDGIPDKIEAKSSIDWSYCNLDGQDISKIKSFDYRNSDRPFDETGIPYDNHENEIELQDKEFYDRERVENSRQESLVEFIYRNILELFGEEYVKTDAKNNFFLGANIKAANLEGANLQNS